MSAAAPTGRSWRPAADSLPLQAIVASRAASDLRALSQYNAQPWVPVRHPDMPGAPRNSGASGNKGAGGTLHRGHGRGRRPERAPSYGTGCVEAQAFWGRAHIEACRRGRGTAAVRTVVALGDGAEWIWRHARAYLGLPDVEMVEIIDLYHAYEYLWAVGNAVFGEGTAAAAWVEPLKTRLYTEGAAPLHAALTTLARTVCIPTADTTAGERGGHGGAAGARVCHDQRPTPGLPRLYGPALPHRLRGGREQLQSRGPGAHQGGRHALERRGGTARSDAARAASLRPVGRLLADPAPARPPPPGPAPAPRIRHSRGPAPTGPARPGAGVSTPG